MSNEAPADYTAESNYLLEEVAKLTLLQIQPFVPVPNWLLSRFWNRDKASGTKASMLLSRVGRTGTKGA